MYQLLVLGAAIFATSFLLNLFWEVSHSALYNWNIPPLMNSVQYYIPRILQSTLGDAVMILAMFGIVALIVRDPFWFTGPTAKNLFALVALGLGFAIGIEIRAMREGRWSYAQAMPLLFGIGLTPLVQLAITGLLTLLILRSWYVR